MKSEILLKLDNVSKIYKMGKVEVPALKNINLEIKKGDFVAIIGASGSGKSTMMNLIGCLDIPTSGKIFLKSKEITTLRESDLAVLRGKSIGFIFQQYNLIPSISAFENVLLPLEFLEFDDDVAVKMTRNILQTVGLADKMHHRPTQLSGGQQQRVSIARSLVTNPEIILADEPTGALDSATGKEVLEILTRLWN
jgi:putative ABC transport system ATP-binding protein